MLLFYPEAAKTVNQISGTAKREKHQCILCRRIRGIGGWFTAAGDIAGGREKASGWYGMLCPSIIISGILLVMTKYLPHTEIKAKTTLGSLKAYVNWPLMALLGMILADSAYRPV